MRLQILCENRLGITREILDILVNFEIDIRGIEIVPYVGVFLSFPALEFSALQAVMPKLRRIQGVTDVSLIPFMPIEQERHALTTLVQVLPEPVLSMDAKGRLTYVNRAAVNLLGQDLKQMTDRSLQQFLQGWTIPESEISQQITTMVRFMGTQFIADIYPIYLPSDHLGEEQDLYSGAVLTLKSPQRLGNQVKQWEKEIGTLEWLSTSSPFIRKLEQQARQLAKTNAALHIAGEIGVGKMKLAQAIHLYGVQQDGPFERINLRTLAPEQQLRHLFGARDQQALLNQVGAGTLVLENFEDLRLELQQQFAAVLQTGQYFDQQAQQLMPMRARLIFTSISALPQLVPLGLDEELRALLAGSSLYLPPLRQRPSDILPLARYYLHQLGLAGQRSFALSPDAAALLKQQSWPGNLRELEQSLMLACAQCDQSGELKLEHLHQPELSNFAMPSEINSLAEVMRNFEADILRQLYPQYPSSRLLARRLGLSHTAVANKLKDYGIGR